MSSQGFAPKSASSDRFQCSVEDAKKSDKQRRRVSVKQWKRLTWMRRPVLGINYRRTRKATKGATSCGKSTPTIPHPRGHTLVKEQTLKSDSYQNMQSLLNANQLTYSSNEDLRQTRPAHRSHTKSAFSTPTTFLVSLTTGNECGKSKAGEAELQRNPLADGASDPNEYDSYDHEITFSSTNAKVALLASNEAYFASATDSCTNVQQKQSTKAEKAAISTTSVWETNKLWKSFAKSVCSKKLIASGQLRPKRPSRQKVSQGKERQFLRAVQSTSSRNFIKSSSRESRISVDSDRSINRSRKKSSSPALVTPPEVMLHGYTFQRQVAGGSFSTLYKCTSFHILEPLACKHIRCSKFVGERACLKDFLKEEIEILKLAEHPNVIEMTDIVSSSTDVYIFMKFASNGTIFDFLYEKTRKPLPEKQAKQLMTELMSGLVYLHGLKIVHRDLKLENFLLDEKYNALLSDFGLAVRQSSPNASKLLAIQCGTVDYMAPELHIIANRANAFYDPFPGDIFAMGVCLFELVNYYRPFAVNLFHESRRSIVARQQNRKFQFNKQVFLENECQDLLNLMLEPKPSLRPTASAVLAHVWFCVKNR